MKISLLVKSLILFFLTFPCISQVVFIQLPIGRVNAASQGLSIQGTERRITANPYDQESPAISNNIISYTDYRGVDADIWYYDLATSTEHNATTASGDQMSSDVSNSTIVYEDTLTNDVYSYSTLTHQIIDLSQDAHSSYPAIGQGLVAWQDFKDGNYEIHAMNLTTNEVRKITNSPGYSDMLPDVSNGKIAWQRNAAIRMLNPYHIYCYDWTSGTTQQITNTGVDDKGQRYPRIDGNIVVYQNGSASGGDICLYNLTNGVETKWSPPEQCMCSYPEISGDFVAFDNYNSTSQTSHIMLLYLPTSSVFMVNVNSTSDQWLGDIDGNRIVYTDDRNGQLDVYMFTFAVNYSLTISSSVGGTTNPPVGTHSYESGANASVSAAPSLSFKFDHWELDGRNAGSSNPISIAMDANHTLTAMFTLVVPGASVGITGYQLVFNETMNNTLNSPATIDYYWSFLVERSNGTLWDPFIQDSSYTTRGYGIPAHTTRDLPYNIVNLLLYSLPTWDKPIDWGDWLRINYTFHWTYNGADYSTAYSSKLHVHPADIAGVTPVAFPYFGADDVVGSKDLHVLGVQWGLSSIGANPTSDVARADINADGFVGTADLHAMGVEWGQTWTNTPPFG